MELFCRSRIELDPLFEGNLNTPVCARRLGLSQFSAASDTIRAGNPWIRAFRLLNRRSLIVKDSLPKCSELPALGALSSIYGKAFRTIDLLNTC